MTIPLSVADGPGGGKEQDQDGARWSASDGRSSWWLKDGHTGLSFAHRLEALQRELVHPLHSGGRLEAVVGPTWTPFYGRGERAIPSCRSPPGFSADTLSDLAKNESYLWSLFQSWIDRQRREVDAAPQRPRQSDKPMNARKDAQTNSH
jgi:hypothetical protein